jgi:hypothetical protein
MKPVAKKAVNKAKPGTATSKTERKTSMADPKHPTPPPPQPAPKTVAGAQAHPQPAGAVLAVRGAPAPEAANVAVNPEDMLTEQEKGGGEGVPGVGPASPSEGSPGPVETIEEQGIGPRTPYPEGNPQVVERYPDGTPVRKELPPLKADAKAKE